MNFKVNLKMTLNFWNIIRKSTEKMVRLFQPDNQTNYWLNIFGVEFTTPFLSLLLGIENVRKNAHPSLHGEK